ncbi:MAG: hypothetical protein BGN90_14085 [Acidovorax sp. 65-7]|nr:MAG: hypothetical protein BGN90_14085 [Acidovorax sp. 65-7]
MVTFGRDEYLHGRQACDLAGLSGIARRIGGKTQGFEFILAYVQFGQFGLTRLDGSPPFEIGGWTFFFLAAILAAAAVHAASAFDTHDDAAGGGWSEGVAYAVCRQWMGHLWAPTEAHSLHQLLAFANIQGAILALHLAQETIVDEGWCLSWGGDALPPKWPFWRASAAILRSGSLRCSGSIS